MLKNPAFFFYSSPMKICLSPRLTYNFAMSISTQKNFRSATRREYLAREYPISIVTKRFNCSPGQIVGNSSTIHDLSRSHSRLHIPARTSSQSLARKRQRRVLSAAKDLGELSRVLIFPTPHFDDTSPLRPFSWRHRQHIHA